MKIAIGNDHAAVELKKTIMEYVESMGHEVTNFGTDSSESCNYPEYGEKVANAVASGEFDCGILICGTGVGISIAANKVNGIRELAKDIVKAYLTAEFEGGRHAKRIAMISDIEARN